MKCTTIFRQQCMLYGNPQLLKFLMSFMSKFGCSGSVTYIWVPVWEKVILVRERERERQIVKYQQRNWIQGFLVRDIFSELITRDEAIKGQYHCVLLGRRNWQENLGAGRAGVGDRLRGLQRRHRLCTPEGGGIQEAEHKRVKHVNEKQVREEGSKEKSRKENVG